MLMGTGVDAACGAVDAQHGSAILSHWVGRVLPTALLALLLAALPAAEASRAGTTPQGCQYVTGGVSHSELLDLHARRDDYDLWVTTAAMKSGAYLADVRVIIRDAANRPMFDQRLDGPWLFIELPQGRYDVEAMLNGESYRRTTTIRKGEHHQVFFYFKTGDDVSPEYRSPFPGNPYDDGRP
jgi:hypothetical protein